jgi:Xaa-Pro aminopeptidase
LANAGRRVGIVGFDFLPASVHARMIASSQSTYEDAGTLLDELRAIKSPAEIALLREAGQATNAGIAAFRDSLREGLTELELAIAVDSATKLAGTSRLTFPTNLGSGPRTTLGSPTPSSRKIARGELVLLDCGGTVGGYCGDASRTAVLGEPSADQRRLLELALAMYEECERLLRPGVPLRDVHIAARALAVEAGLRYGSETGHSIGCENHERPVMDDADPALLSAGMVVAVEPALVLDGVGGVRIEDTFLITDDGCDALTSGSLQLWE